MAFSSIILLLYVFGFIVVAAIVRRTRTWFRLRHIPGPPTAGFLEWWNIKHTLGGRMNLDTAEACEKYGPLVRIGPNQLVTNDFETWKRVNNVRTKYRRSNWYNSIRLRPGQDNVISQRDGVKHASLRAKMAAGYSGKENDHLEQSIDTQISNFIRLIEEKYLSTELQYRPVDFAQKIQFFTLDTITSIAFGEAFGYLESDSDLYSYIQKTTESFGMMMLGGLLPWLVTILHSPLLQGFIPSEKDLFGLGKIMNIAHELVAQRFGPDMKERRDMLGSFVRHGLTQKEAEVESLVQILAGSDTTATAIRTMMLYVVANPLIYSRLLAEITNSQISSPITDSEARAMPYLQAIIKEGLRIHPPVTGAMYKDVPAGGDTLNGMYIPEGTSVGWSVWGLMQDMAVWGEDAKVFRPERWFQGTPEEIKNKDARVDMVFNYGKWQCLGKEVGKIELNKILVELLRHFEFTLVKPQVPWKSVNLGLFIQTDMWMRITKREPLL